MVLLRLIYDTALHRIQVSHFLISQFSKSGDIWSEPELNSVLSGVLDADLHFEIGILAGEVHLIFLWWFTSDPIPIRFSWLVWLGRVWELALVRGLLEIGIRWHIAEDKSEAVSFNSWEVATDLLGQKAEPAFSLNADFARRILNLPSFPLDLSEVIGYN